MKVGLALGGGGARGLAHLLVLETLESLGIRPHRIAGTSIGAIVGTLYGSGVSATEMRASAQRLIQFDGQRLSEWFQNPSRPMHWLQFLSPHWGLSGLLKVDRFLDQMRKQFSLTTLDELSIPMQIVSADFWSREQVVFESGDAMTAIHASIAVPGILSPVLWEDRLLIDGGAVNPVPFDLLFDDCDITIAVDIMGTRSTNDRLPPSFLETMLGTFQIMQRSIINQKLALRPPDIYISPDIHGVRVLEFNKAEQIYAQSQPACEELRVSLETLLDQH